MGDSQGKSVTEEKTGDSQGNSVTENELPLSLGLGLVVWINSKQ